MKKVLIVTYYFPPVNIIASRRFGEMSPYMEKFGWKPYVLTTKSTGDLPMRIPEKQIIRLGENCDSQKTLVAAEGYRGIPLVLKPLYFLYRTWNLEFTSLDRFIFSWGREVINMQELFKQINPDLLIASYQPAASLWVGRMLAKRLKKPWIADMRDACSLYNPSHFVPIKLFDRIIDRFVMKSADRIVTISPQLASIMEKFYQKQADVVYNGFDTRQDIVPPVVRKKRSNLLLYYAGRFHPHRVAAAKLLIDWLSLDRKRNACFRARSLGPREANEEIARYAKEKGIGEKVQILPSASSQLIMKEEQEADVLLVFEDITKMNPISQTNMTGKLFEYLPSKAPIIAITRKDSDMRGVLDDTKRGFLASSIDELADAITRIQKGTIPIRRTNRILGYSRESQCKKLCKIMDAVLRKKP